MDGGWNKALSKMVPADWRRAIEAAYTVLLRPMIHLLESCLHFSHANRMLTNFFSALITAINPMGLVPAMDDNGFHLFESHAILRYLACAYPNVKDHWYPADLRKRAQSDCILDWHHTGLRRGSAGLVMNRVIAPAIGRALDPHAASEAESLIKASLKMMETLWLKDDGTFLTGSLQPSIADLSLACEVMQLQLLDKDNVSELLNPNPKVKKWLDAVEKTLSPHFVQVHEKLQKAATMYQKRRERELKKGESVDGPTTQAKL